MRGVQLARLRRERPPTFANALTSREPRCSTGVPRGAADVPCVAGRDREVQIAYADAQFATHRPGSSPPVQGEVTVSENEPDAGVAPDWKASTMR